jgi:hypothetical protein
MPLLRLFVDICLFRKGPQDAPTSRMLLKLVLAAYLLANLLITLLESPWHEGLLKVVLEVLILLGFVWISLIMAGKPNRWLQTTISLLGTDALINSLALPLEAYLMADPKNGFIPWLLLLMMFWQIAVVAHILRHALSQPLAVGFGLAIVYVAFSIQVIVLLFGMPAAG